MEAQFESRKQKLLDECKVPPKVFEDVTPRLKQFLEPFIDGFVRREQVEHCEVFVQGLLSDLDHKNVESIAYRFGESRLPLQWFMGVSEWNDKPLREELVRQVGRELGEEDGIIVFDPSGFPKSGHDSVGVARQWCGRLGKIENCQIAVYMGYVSQREHALVDTRLYLPKEWAKDKKRRKKAGVPKEVRYQTRHQLCLEMLEANSDHLPHKWITGDDEMGRPYWFRKRLHQLDEQYLLAVPSNTLIRDLDADPPPYSGKGHPPKRPWIRLDKWINSQPKKAWVQIDVRDAAKGPIVVELIKRRVAARTDQRKQGDEELLVIIRYRDRDDQSVKKTDYYLSDAPPDTHEAELARVAKAEHRIEECIQRAKSEAGLSDYELRNWTGWHHHQTLSLIATWFLITETRRGKKMDTGNYSSADSRRYLRDPLPNLRMRYSVPSPNGTRATIETQRTSAPLSLETV